MSSRTTFAALCLLLLTFATAGAQTPTAGGGDRGFNLKHQKADTTTTAEKKKEVQRKVFAPHILPNRLEASLTLGFLDLNNNLIEYPGRMIYKRTTEYTYYGDVSLKGKSAFNPVLRVGYTLTPWLGVESVWGISVSEYSSTISNTLAKSNDINSQTEILNPEVGPYDAEQRSMITLNTGLNAVCYPLNLWQDRESHWHPFLVGGVGGSWFSMNSNYADKPASSMTLTGGGGLRLIADKLISVRIEVLYNYSQIRFRPADQFLNLNGGTLIVPVDTLPAEGPPVPVKEFQKETIGALSWGIGFIAAF